MHKYLLGALSPFLSHDSCERPAAMWDARNFMENLLESLQDTWALDICRRYFESLNVQGGKEVSFMLDSTHSYD